MDKGETSHFNDDLTPSYNFKKLCLELLDRTLHKFFLENKSIAEDVGAQQLKEQFFNLSSNFNQDSDDAFKVSRLRNYLQIVHGALLIFGASSKLCVGAVCSSSCPFVKKDFVDYSIGKLIHEDDQQNFIDDSIESNEICLFNCRLRKGDNQVIGAKQNNCETVSYMMMKCIKFVEHVNKEKLVDIDTTDSSFLFCLATPADGNVSFADEVPPNQTIHTRDKIPQPEKFCTLQDLNGELKAVGLSYEDLRTSKYKVPSDMKDVVQKCLSCFMSSSQNGKSLKDNLLQQVLSQGKGSTRTNRIQLADGAMANWLTKSEIVPRVAHPGEMQQIFSVHLVYKQGKLKGLNLQGLRNIIPESQLLSSKKEETVTMTTTSIATTTSFSPDHFLSSSHYPNPTVKNETFIGERASYPAWQRSGRNGLEATKGFLSGIPATEPKVENLNGVVPPPPHLDGPLVHAVGGGSNQMMTSAPENFQISSVPSGNVTNFHSSEAGARNSFLSSNSDTGMLNPGTYPGPPCVDLGSCNMAVKSEGHPPVSSISSASVYVDGITTMRMDANVTTTQCRMPAINTATVSATSSANMLSTTFSPNSTRACATPDKVPLSCQNSPPKRPRSASINTTAGGSGSLKRTASTLSEDSGIGELGHSCKRSPIQRSKSKDKSVRKNKILAQLLSSKNSDDVSVSYTGGSSSKSSSANIASSQPISTSSSVLATSLSYSSATSSISLPNPASVSKVPLQAASYHTTLNQVNPLASQPNLNASQPTNPSAEISPDEREALDEIFSCYESIISSPPPPQQQHRHTSVGNVLPHQQSFVETNPFPISNPSIIQRSVLNNNILPPSRQVSESMVSTPPSNPPLNQHNDMFAGLSTQPQTLLSSTQPQPTSQVLPTPQTLSGPPPYALNTASPSAGNNSAYRRIVPTGQETCPNRVVGSGGILSPKTQQVPPASQYHRDYGPTDNWAGQEPLVDLGAFPPPSGINPRMAIPSPSQISHPGQPMLGTPGVKIPPNVNVSNPQTSMNRMAFRSNSMGMSGGTMQVNLPAHLQNPSNNGIAPSVSPRNYANTVSPSGFPQIRSANSSIPPAYNVNNIQQQRLPNTGNIRARLLRQQRPGLVPFRGDVTMSGAQPYHYNKPELPRYLPQRPNGAMMSPRKPPMPQRAISSPVISPGAQTIYNQMNPSSRFAANQTPTNQYSNITPNHFANSTSFNNELSPSMNIDAGMRPTGVMPPQNSNQFSSPSYTNTMSNMGSVMVNSYLGDQINPVLPGSPIVKPQLKRSRSKKATRKKAGSTEEGPWVDEMTNNGYKQPPLIQMTIGDMHQRPQPTYNTPLDGAMPSNPSMMSPQSGSMQTLNLNSMLDQSKKINVDTGPGSFQSIPNPSSLQQQVPTAANSWSGPEVPMTSSIMDDGMLTMFEDPLSTQTNNTFALEGMTTVDSNVTMNSNINNNNIAEVGNSFRYTATATMLPGTSNASQMADNRPEKTQKRTTKLLESLLLQKDE